MHKYALASWQCGEIFFSAIFVLLGISESDAKKMPPTRRQWLLSGVLLLGLIGVIGCGIKAALSPHTKWWLWVSQALLATYSIIANIIQDDIRSVLDRHIRPRPGT